MKKRERLAIIRQHYPNAITTIDSVNRIIDYVEEQLDLDSHQIMMADSICSDDVNSIQYPARAHEFLGPFKMGGLDGFPFAGLTGMGAFAAHVPDDGAVFIYYGPHIGITAEGVVGEIRRIGQQNNSGCCGAAKAALSHLLKNEIKDGYITELDYQINIIEQLFFKERERIKNAAEPLKEATEVMYEAIDKRVNELVAQTDFHCKYILLMGAILINSDSEMGSYNSTKRFDVIDLEKKERKSVDLFTF